MHALLVPVAVTPVDAVTRGAVTAMQTKMAAMSQWLMAKSGELQTTTDDSAAAMQAQDANNASPLKDLASSIPSGGGGGNGAQTLGGSPGLGKIQAFDHTFKMDGGNNSAPSPHVCTTRDEWDSGLSILGGGGETIAGGAGLNGIGARVATRLFPQRQNQLAGVFATEQLEQGVGEGVDTAVLDLLV